MINIETKTKLSPEDAIKQALNFFGPGGMGMQYHIPISIPFCFSVVYNCFPQQRKHVAANSIRRLSLKE
jgi:hypothetical protein